MPTGLVLQGLASQVTLDHFPRLHAAAAEAEYPFSQMMEQFCFEATLEHMLVVDMCMWATTGATAHSCSSHTALVHLPFVQASALRGEYPDLHSNVQGAPFDGVSGQRLLVPVTGAAVVTGAPV